jgi:5-formyltetrahydrofolate cyclo-ligase
MIGPAVSGMTKEELRSRLGERRSALTPEEVEHAGNVVLAELRRLVEWGSVRRAHVYRSVAAWREVDTAGLIAWLRADWPQIELTIPSLRRDQPIPEEPFDLVVVPVLGYDREWNRLGLGGGFYDRFLARQPQALKVGIAYSWALVPEGLPVEEHDVPLDLVVTA